MCRLFVLSAAFFVLALNWFSLAHLFTNSVQMENFLDFKKYPRENRVFRDLRVLAHYLPVAAEKVLHYAPAYTERAATLCCRRMQPTLSHMMK